MSLFAYEAITHRGRRRRGEIEAESERVARRLLKRKGLIPRSLAPVQQEKAGGGGDKSGRLSAEDALLLLQQLAALLTGGVPLVDALDVIAEGMESKRARRVVIGIRQQVLEGSSLAQSLALYHLDPIVCNMVAAGEETGQLSAVASRLTELLEQRRRFKQELLAATLYPLIVTGFGLLVMAFLLAVVVPQVAGVFARTGNELPTLTQALISFSQALRSYGWMLPPLLLALALGYRLALRHTRWRKLRDRALLHLPAVGRLLIRINLARFARTLGMLLAGGVPVLSALHIAAQSLNVLPLRDGVLAAKETLREGGSLSEQLAQSPYVPYLAVRLIAVGEQSGALDSMLLRLADHYEADASRSLKQTATLLEPILVLIMAVIVGAMAVAILLPIVEMNELLKH